jgi:CO dehydrogenase maturation factor
VLAYRLLEALHEEPGWSLVTMGRTDTRGCFCSVNGLIRDGIDALAASFDHLLVDAEAGVEQAQRNVTRAITRAVVVCDGSQRALRTAQLLHELLVAERPDGERDPSRAAPALCAVLNRMDGPSAPACRALEALELPVVAALPPDPALARFDREGRPLFELDRTSPAVTALRPLADWLLAPRASGGSPPRGEGAAS